MKDNKINMKKKENLISNLVKKFDEYMGSITEKRKILSMFSEFDERARKDLFSLL